MLAITRTCLLCFGALFLLSLSAHTTAATTGRGLVLLENLQFRNTHSLFFKSLEELYTLDYHEAADPKLELSRYGEYLYDILVIFAPSIDALGGSLNVDAVLNFIDDGHSVLLAGSPEISEVFREIATECGVEFEDEDTFVVDHFNYDKSDFDGEHTLLVADNLLKDVPIITGKNSAPVLWRGVGHTLEKENNLVIPILRASSTAYSASETNDLGSAGKGTDLLLISALQARNNARVIVSGSLEFFSDKFFQSSVQKHTVDGKEPVYEKSGNEELSKNLVRWTFGKQGILRSSNVRHHLVGESAPRTMYTIKEDIEYRVDIEEWNGKEWKPYNATDVQVEFVMLHPYVRTTLHRVSPKSATFATSFKIPDVYGIYTFRFVYSRPGYTSLSEINRVTIRPLRHDQYERFIVSAYPYYAASFSMMVGLVLFSFFFLYNKEVTAQKKEE